MNKINLTKFGFVRWEEEDFSDDGNRFYCYRAGRRVRVSKCTWNGQVYLSGHIDSSIIDYHVYSTLPHYNGLDRLNGVSIASLTENDLIQLYNDCIEFEKEFDEAEKKVVFPTIEELREQCIRVRENYSKQLAEAHKYIEANAVKLVLKASSWKLDTIRRYLSTLESRANGFDPATYPQSIQKSSYGINFAKPTNTELTDRWYCNQIIKEIDAIA